jgi:hypothetical protein
MDYAVTVMCPCGYLNQFQDMSPDILRVFQRSAQEKCQRCYKPLDVDSAHVESWQEPRSHDPFDNRTGGL